ncbi:MAG: hypothetical protein R3277_07470 [Brumimicrobium sp.]|nr:hypothetical protein [Brumimicrobium sp.]
MKFKKKALLIYLLLVLIPITASGQGRLKDYFSKIELHIDTNIYSLQENSIFHKNTMKLAFEHETMNPVVLVKLFPSEEALRVGTMELVSSPDYTVLDTLALMIEGYYQCKIQFNHLQDSEFLNIRIKAGDKMISIPLFPYSHTYATIYPGDEELFIGEVKKYPLITNNEANIDIDPRWIKKDNYEYRIFREDNNIMIAILPLTTGDISLDFTLHLHRPNFEKGNLNYQLESDKFFFKVKGSRLSFLNFDNKEIIWNREDRTGVELQIDNHPKLEINKTYRIEATDEKGGPLIAEMYTVRRLSNERVLCSFRPYNYHKISKGYLFIKDGDSPKFITNINILREPKITGVSILREGGSWVNSKQIYPGETVEVRFEGEGLSRAEFKFEDLKESALDSVIHTDFVSHHILTVPIDIHKKSVQVYNGNKKTGITLDIQEYQKPREFDFIVIEHGTSPAIVSNIKEPILHRGTIGDVNIHFDGRYIDERNELYGKQFLEIEIRIKDNNNKLVEKQVIDNIEVCPGSNSPRSFSYTSKDGCTNPDISVNDYLSNKTYSLENWSTVELIIKHRKEFYESSGYSTRIEIIKEKLVTFDVDLSIPAGLIIKTVGEEGFPGLTGISLSMLAQFSFYQKGEVQRLRPYKVGAGFLAKNAFNFNPEAERDLGIVILGSVYPTRKNRKFSFPLYAGMGYFLNEEKFFYLIGPGVRINF